MPRVTLLQTNFTAGEWSPRLRGRVDVDRYNNAAKFIQNLVIQVQGGVKRRGGFSYVREVKDSTKRTRLIPFTFNKDQAYMLEFGAGYVRFIKNGAYLESLPGVPYEITSPYTEAQLFAVDYAQGADTMFLAHPNVPMQRLRRFSDFDWQIDAVPFDPSPFAEIGFRPEAKLSLSTPTVGVDRVFTADFPVFLDGDVGREIRAGVGRAIIRQYISTTQVRGDILTPFLGYDISGGGFDYASGQWKIDGTPQCPITPGAKDPIGETITITSAAGSQYGPLRTVTAVGAISGGQRTYTSAAHGFIAGDVIFVQGTVRDRTFSVVSVTVNTFTVNENAPGGTGWGAYTPGSGGFPPVYAQKVLPSAAGNCWRATDVGSHVEINGGLVQITSYESTTVVRGKIVRVLSGTTQAKVGGWRLLAPVWNQFDGYPRTVTLFEQRLFAAGSPNFPQTLWASATGEYLNFRSGTDDSNAFSFVVASDQQNEIAYLCSTRTLIALTYGGEFTIHGGIEKPITPTNYQVRARGNHGCALVRPVKVKNEELFVQRAGKRIRALSYNATNEEYLSPDITRLSEHLFAGGIADLHWQQEPEPIVWAVTAGGLLMSCAYEREEEVTGWSRHITSGIVESIAAIPNATGETLYAVIQRTINGQAKRYVEILTEGIYTDSAVTLSNGSPQTVWSGLGHLALRQVDVLADGIYVGTYTVTAGGEITLPRAASTIQAGLIFLPYLELLKPELQMPDGSAQGNSMRIGETTITVLDTIGLVVNGQQQEIRRLDSGPLLDLPPVDIDGDLQVGLLGWDRGDAQLIITQPQPLPCHILSVARKITVNS